MATSRQRLFVGLILLILILVGLGMLNRSRLPASGDPLFDRYAAYIWNDLQARRKQEQDPMPRAFVPLTVLDEWQVEFEHDPRYWELRSQAAFWQGIDAYHQGGSNSSVSGAELLQTTASAAGLELLAAHDAGRLDARGLTLLWLAAHNEGENPTTEYLDQAIELDPQYSWGWYLRGLYYLDKGDKDRATKDLAKGNTLPLVPSPKPFPHSVFSNAILTGQPRAALKIWTYSRSPQAVMWTRTPFVTQITSVDFVEHPELLTESNRFTCRMFEADPGNLLTALIALSITGWIAARVSEHAEETAVDKELLVMLDDVDSIHSRMGAVGTKWLKLSTQFLPKNNPGIQGSLDSAVATVGGLFSKNTSWNHFRKQSRKEAVYTERNYSPYFKALASVDYAEPIRVTGAKELLKSTPDPYPKQTNKKVQRRRKAQREIRSAEQMNAVEQAARSTAEWVNEASSQVSSGVSAR